MRLIICDLSVIISTHESGPALADSLGAEVLKEHTTGPEGELLDLVGRYGESGC